MYSVSEGNRTAVLIVSQVRGSESDIRNVTPLARGEFAMIGNAAGRPENARIDTANCGSDSLSPETRLNAADQETVAVPSAICVPQELTSMSCHTSDEIPPGPV